MVVVTLAQTDVNVNCVVNLVNWLLDPGIDHFFNGVTSTPLHSQIGSSQVVAHNVDFHSSGDSGMMYSEFHDSNKFFPL